jgi:hypothetical protein
MKPHEHPAEERSSGGWTVKRLVAHLEGMHNVRLVTRNLIRLARYHHEDHEADEATGQRRRT